jgi:lysophospholipase L1-like esterase
MPLVKLISIVAVILLAWGFHLSPVHPSQPASAARATYLALGDSYTIGESVGAADRYPQQVVGMLNEADPLLCRDPSIIAVTGWTTGNLLEAISMAEPANGSGKPRAVYDMVSLLIGVNNQYQGRSQAEYRDQFTLLLQKSIWLAGNNPAHVLVLSIPDYSVTPFGRTRDTVLIAAQIDSFNRINYSVSMAYKVNYIDVTAESRKAARDPTLVAEDGLHFSGKEYGNWARLMEPVMKGMLH